MKKETEIYVHRSVGMDRSFTLYQEALRLKVPDQIVSGYRVYSGGVLGDANSNAYCEFKGFDKRTIIGCFSYPQIPDRSAVEITMYRKIRDGFEISYCFTDIDAAHLYAIDERVTRHMKNLQVFPAVVNWLQ